MQFRLSFFYLKTNKVSTIFVRSMRIEIKLMKNVCITCYVGFTEAYEPVTLTHIFNRDCTQNVFRGYIRSIHSLH